MFLQVFAWSDHKIVLFWSAEQFYEHIMQKPAKTGKYTEINKQSDVKFWLNWIRYEAVSYALSCTVVCNSEIHNQKLKKYIKCFLSWPLVLGFFLDALDLKDISFNSVDHLPRAHLFAHLCAHFCTHLCAPLCAHHCAPLCVHLYAPLCAHSGAHHFAYLCAHFCAHLHAHPNETKNNSNWKKINVS